MARITFGMSGRFGSSLAVALGAWLAIGAPARAGQMVFPKERPDVAFDVPDGWTTDVTDGQLEMRSPEKNSIVVGRVIGRDKAFLEAWANQAAAKLKSFGVVFDPNGKAKPDVAAPALVAPSTSAFTTDPGKFTFSGAPSLAPPGEAQSNNPIKAPANSVESLTGFGTTITKMPKLPFHAVQYYGTTMNGKPVDVQLVIYNLSDQRRFVMMQESGPDDGRAVGIAQSVRSAKSK